MKRVITYLLVLSLLLVPGAKTAQAALGTDQSVLLTINGSKTASISVSAKGTASVKQIHITSYLQRYKDGKWTTITSWSKTVYSNTASFSKTHSLSVSGKYRVQAIIKYTGNSTTESHTINSTTKTC